jgi:hypothetical protein
MQGCIILARPLCNTASTHNFYILQDGPSILSKVSFAMAHSLSKHGLCARRNIAALLNLKIFSKTLHTSPTFTQNQNIGTMRLSLIELSTKSYRSSPHRCLPVLSRTFFDKNKMNQKVHHQYWNGHQGGWSWYTMSLADRAWTVSIPVLFLLAAKAHLNSQINTVQLETAQDTTTASCASEKNETISPSHHDVEGNKDATNSAVSSLISIAPPEAQRVKIYAGIAELLIFLKTYRSTRKSQPKLVHLVFCVIIVAAAMSKAMEVVKCILLSNVTNGKEVFRPEEVHFHCPRENMTFKVVGYRLGENQVFVPQCTLITKTIKLSSKKP